MVHHKAPAQLLVGHLATVKPLNHQLGGCAPQYGGLGGIGRMEETRGERREQDHGNSASTRPGQGTEPHVTAELAGASPSSAAMILAGSLSGTSRLTATSSTPTAPSSPSRRRHS